MTYLHASLNFRISKRTESVPTRPSETYQRQFTIWDHQMTQLHPLMYSLWFIGNKRTNCCATTVETSLHIVLHMESSILRNHTGPTSSIDQGWLTIPDHDFRSSLRHCQWRLRPFRTYNSITRTIKARAVAEVEVAHYRRPSGPLSGPSP